jgi:hypothetical protein
MILQEALECVPDLSSDSKKSEALKNICIELSSQGMIEKALEFTQNISDESDKINTLINISNEYAKKGMITESLECARGLRSISGKSKALRNVSTELAKSGDWLRAESTCFEIPLLEEQQSCWKNIAQKIHEEFGMEKAILIVNNLQNKESKKYYLKGIVENLCPTESNKQRILNVCRYYLNDIESLQLIFQQYALHEIFFVNISEVKLDRFNRTLNLQWAIDLKKELDQIPN